MEDWAGFPETSATPGTSIYDTKPVKSNGLEPGCGDSKEGRERSIAISLKRLADHFCK